MASTTYNPRGKEESKSMEHLDKAKEAGGDALSKAKQAGQEAIGMAKDAGSEAIEKAKDMGADVLGKAKEAAASMGEVASSAASAVGQRANDLTAAAGHGIKEFGDNMAKNAPQGGMAGAASKAVAEGIRESGSYLEEAKLSGIASDVEKVVKTHPIPALLICFGVGYCLGRAMRD